MRQITQIRYNQRMKRITILTAILGTAFLITTLPAQSYAHGKSRLHARDEAIEELDIETKEEAEEGIEETEEKPENARERRKRQREEARERRKSTPERRKEQSKAAKEFREELKERRKERPLY